MKVKWEGGGVGGVWYYLLILLQKYIFQGNYFFCVCKANWVQKMDKYMLKQKILPEVKVSSHKSYAPSSCYCINRIIYLAIHYWIDCYFSAAGTNISIRVQILSSEFTWFCWLGLLFHIEVRGTRSWYYYPFKYYTFSLYLISSTTHFSLFLYLLLLIPFTLSLFYCLISIFFSFHFPFLLP